MSKLLPTISGVACFLWVSGWTWIFSEGKHAETASSNPIPTNILIDNMQYQVQHPFSFEYSEAIPVISENLLPLLKSVAHKIEIHSNLKLKILGIYSPSEVNQTSFPNLGEARASSLKSLLITSGAAAEQIETAGMEAENLFEVEGKLSGLIYFNFVKIGPDNQAVAEKAIAEKEAAASEKTTSFYYKYGDYKVEKQYLSYLTTLKKELQAEAIKSVVLTGYSAPEEEAASARINLAELRALSIRRYLVDHGVRRSQIEVVAKPAMASNSSEMTVTIQVIEQKTN